MLFAADALLTSAAVISLRTLVCLNSAAQSTASECRCRCCVEPSLTSVLPVSVSVRRILPVASAPQFSSACRTRSRSLRNLPCWWLHIALRKHRVCRAVFAPVRGVPGPWMPPTGLKFSEIEAVVQRGILIPVMLCPGNAVAAGTKVSKGMQVPLKQRTILRQRCACPVTPVSPCRSSLTFPSHSRMRPQVMLTMQLLTATTPQAMLQRSHRPVLANAQTLGRGDLGRGVRKLTAAVAPYVVILTVIAESVQCLDSQAWCTYAAHAGLTATAFSCSLAWSRLEIARATAIVSLALSIQEVNTCIVRMEAKHGKTSAWNSIAKLHLGLTKVWTKPEYVKWCFQAIDDADRIGDLNPADITTTTLLAFLLQPAPSTDST